MGRRYVVGRSAFRVPPPVLGIAAGHRLSLTEHFPQGAVEHFVRYDLTRHILLGLLGVPIQVILLLALNLALSAP